MFKWIVLLFAGFVVSGEENGEYIARTITKWQRYGISIVISVVIGIFSYIPFWASILSGYEGWWVAAVVTCVVLGVFLKIPIDNAIDKMNICQNCGKTAAFKLQKEEVITERVASEGSGKERKTYRIGNKRGFFKCSHCGFEETLDTPYKKRA